MIEAIEIQANKEMIIKILRETGRAEIESLITFLENSDFFKAPASTKYHGAYDGGLAEHSLHVWYLLNHKNLYFHLDLSTDNIAIVALLHDVCKINFYGKEMKNVIKGMKDNGYGKQVKDWQEEETVVVKDQFPIGHGEKSVITLLRYIQLTDLEIAMIRWHMGGYVPRDEYRDLDNAVNMYPAIVALHAADLEATHLLKIGGKEA